MVFRIFRPAHFSLDNFGGGILDELQPLLGVTDLVLEAVGDEPDLIKKLLLEDLRQLTLRRRPFLLLWDRGIVTLLLDRNWSLNEGGCKILVMDEAGRFDDMWYKYTRLDTKVVKYGASLRSSSYILHVTLGLSLWDNEISRVARKEAPAKFSSKR